MQASKKHSFLRRSPLAYVVVPLAFVLVSTALVFIVGRTVLAPYQALLGWFFSTTEVAQPRDLLDNAATVINGGTVDEPDAQPDRLPLSSVTYPSRGPLRDDHDLRHQRGRPGLLRRHEQNL